MRWAQIQQFPMQSLSKTVFKPDIVTFFEKQTYIILLINSPQKFAETIFLDTAVYKGTRFNEKVILDVLRLRKPSSTHFALCHPLICQRSLRSVSYFKRTLDGQRLPTQFERKIAIRNKWNSQRLKSALLKQNSEEEKEMLPFVTQYKLLVSTIREVLMEKWNLIQNQPLLKNHPLFPTRKENHGKEHAC